MNCNRVKEVLGKLKMVLQDREGMVLVLVLIVLVAAIITGVIIMRTSALEARIAGNERAYVETFNTLESATSFALTMNTAALSAIATSIGATYTYPSASLPQNLRDAHVSVTAELDRIGKPPKNAGYDPSLKSRFYTFEAKDASGNQRLTVGAYKVFPPTTE